MSSNFLTGKAVHETSVDSHLSKKKLLLQRKKHHNNCIKKMIELSAFEFDSVIIYKKKN